MYDKYSVACSRGQSPEDPSIRSRDDPPIFPFLNELARSDRDLPTAPNREGGPCDHDGPQPMLHRRTSLGHQSKHGARCVAGFGATRSLPCSPCPCHTGRWVASSVVEKAPQLGPERLVCVKRRLAIDELAPVLPDRPDLATARALSTLAVLRTCSQPPVPPWDIPSHRLRTPACFSKGAGGTGRQPPIRPAGWGYRPCSGVPCQPAQGREQSQSNPQSRGRATVHSDGLSETQIRATRLGQLLKIEEAFARLLAVRRSRPAVCARAAQWTAVDSHT